jgi:sugar O-acyltransferase (sialic acid O-acetyltransferase NeuD family)
MKAKRIVVIGAGGFAREVRWLIEEINRASPTPEFEFKGYAVSDLSKLGEHDSREEVLGDYEWIEAHRGDVDVLTIGIGTPGSRLKVSSELEQRFPELEWPSLVHPSAIYDRARCRLEKGTLFCAGVIGTVNVLLEPFAMVNLACTLGHEAVLGRGCVLNPTVNISGGVVLEEGVLVGTGAQILQYVRVGRNATIGAGAVVTKDVPPGQTVVGIPARPLTRSATS